MMMGRPQTDCVSVNRQSRYYGRNCSTAADLKKKVLSIYSKSGGKNGKHGWVAQVTSIASASNLVIRLFRPMFRHQFRIQYTNAFNSLAIKRYALLQNTNILFMFSTTPKISETFLHLISMNGGKGGVVPS